MTSTDSIAELHSAVNQAARALRDGEPTGPEPSLERPRKPELGDYSSNAAMLLAAPLGESPRDVAERLQAELERDLAGSESLERIEVAGPGFVNLFLSDAWYRRAMASLGAAGERLGPAPAGSPERILVEFVSANPTGPLHVGGGRHAAYGDALVRLLEAVGHDVKREFYVNDAGGQVERFADSIAARMTGAEMPEDGYEGAYVAELAERIAAEGVDPADPEALGRRGVELVLEGVRASLDRFGVRFDTWFSERDLYQRGEVDAALAQLDENGHTYRSSIASMRGVYILGVSAENRAAAGVAAGDVVDLDIEVDSAPRVVAVPEDFAAALDREPPGRTAFDSLAYSHQLRHVLAIDDAKTPETRQRRIAKAVGMLTDGT